MGGIKFSPIRACQGTLAGLLICAVITFLYLRWQDFPSGELLVLSLLGGFAGAVAELLPLNIDDNFAIPVVSGGALMALAPLEPAQLPLAP